MFRNAPFKPPRLVRKENPEQNLFVPESVSEPVSRHLGTRRPEKRLHPQSALHPNPPKRSDADPNINGENNSKEIQKEPILQQQDQPRSSGLRREPSYQSQEDPDRANPQTESPLLHKVRAPRLHSVARIAEPEPESKKIKVATRYFTAQWRKRSTRKHKPWEGDGCILVTNTGSVLKIEQKGSFRPVGRSKNTDMEGILRFGSYEAEIDCETTKEELNLLGQPSQTSSLPARAPAPPMRSKSVLGRFNVTQEQKNEKPNLQRAAEVETTPLLSPLVRTPEPQLPPLEYEKLVLPGPNIPGVKTVEVDPLLTKHLKPHQREGVAFVYSCLLGLRLENYFGALLADEMGLGKTLMTISVIWTLLKQSPFPEIKKMASKIVICCPVSLIDNWRREFAKWLGTYRIGVLCLNNKQTSASREKEDIVNFGKNNVYQVLVMSYEKALSCSQELSVLNLDLLVCDEGHRLKSSANRVFKVLLGLQVEKRLILTGTPIQNDLNEFFTIINFINPGILGSAAEFQKSYLRPILRARDVNCRDPTTIRDGEKKSAELISLTKSFILRRTKDVISSFLPAKTDVIVFCAPTKLQKSLFSAVVESARFNSVLKSETKDVLSMILLFRKICNSPSLLQDDLLFASFTKGTELASLPLSSKTTGSKINVLVPLLLEFHAVGEKVVLVSNYAQTLDFLETVLLKLNHQYCRLDGSTPGKARDKLVHEFNKCPTYKVFLLSAKAGGVGLNLVGASRLILFDNDWNPLVDLQAMARVHRYGQTKPVFIYRLFTTGAIDEKIFQRQLMKNNLSDMFLDEKTDSALNIFDFDDLKDLFTIVDTSCNTHDLIDCDCNGAGEYIDLSQPQPTDTQEDDECPSSGWMSALEYKEIDKTSEIKKQVMRTALSNYKHFDPEMFESEMDTGDAILNKLMMRTKTERAITYVLTNVNHPDVVKEDDDSNASGDSRVKPGIELMSDVP